MSQEKNPQVEMKVLDQRLLEGRFGLPDYGTLGAAGIDLRAMFDTDNETVVTDGEETLMVGAGETVLIPTGISVNINDPSIAIQILPRSGLGHKSGIVLGNLVGLIDSDYQGQLMISCWNRSDKPFIIYLGDRIAQMVFVPVIHPAFKLVTEFSEKTLRGEGGFGHTGVGDAQLDNKPWQVWTEGYLISGGSSQAEYHGTFEARTFQEAIEMWYGVASKSERKYMNADHTAFYGCRFFDNETDARKSFG